MHQAVAVRRNAQVQRGRVVWREARVLVLREDERAQRQHRQPRQTCKRVGKRARRLARHRAVPQLQLREMQTLLQHSSQLLRGLASAPAASAPDSASANEGGCDRFRETVFTKQRERRQPIEVPRYVVVRFKASKNESLESGACCRGLCNGCGSLTGDFVSAHVKGRQELLLRLREHRSERLSSAGVERTFGNAQLRETRTAEQGCRQHIEEPLSAEEEEGVGVKKRLESEPEEAAEAEEAALPHGVAARTGRGERGSLTAAKDAYDSGWSRTVTPSRSMRVLSEAHSGWQTRRWMRREDSGGRHPDRQVTAA
eukprot:2643000-Rhodomonas_salina.3